MHGWSWGICSHVAAILFLLEYIWSTKSKENEKSCTEILAYWVKSGKKTLSPKKIGQISFSTTKATNPSQVPKNRKLTLNYLPMKKVHSEQEAKPVLDMLFQTNPGSAILKICKPYCNQCREKSFPLCFHTLLNENKYGSLRLHELIEEGKKLDLKLSKDDILYIEEETRLQSKISSWYLYRTGRITASNAKSVCRVKTTTSNFSLISSICYPEQNKFSTAATKYGCDHEGVARKKYEEVMIKEHQQFEVRESGFFIHSDIPYIGASPDGKTSCLCCGDGILEIKCPFCVKDKEVSSLIYLSEESGKLTISKDHSYYYQVYNIILYNS